MPSTELTKGVHKKILTSAFVDQLLSLLEKFSDETFWTNLFGERILNLLKKYFGSDVMFLGLIVYIAPIIGYRINSLFYYLLSEVKTRMYVTIHLSKNEMGYTPVQEFVASQTTQIRNLREVEAKCIDDDGDEVDLQGPSPPPKVHLYPMEETEQKFTYKGYTLWVTKRKNGSTEKQNLNYYSNDIKELFGMMNVNPTLQITMRGQNMNLLKGFIQEWINMHHEKENGKVN
ncbi:hypothetical protein K501DRAFT_313055, partial [Backusella circina FSU 941]